MKRVPTPVRRTDRARSDVFLEEVAAARGGLGFEAGDRLDVKSKSLSGGRGQRGDDGGGKLIVSHPAPDDNRGCRKQEKWRRRSYGAAATISLLARLAGLRGMRQSSRATSILECCIRELTCMTSF